MGGKVVNMSCMQTNIECPLAVEDI